VAIDPQRAINRRWEELLARRYPGTRWRIVRRALTEPGAPVNRPSADLTPGGIGATDDADLEAAS
jgi:hypothetical protein